MVSKSTPENNKLSFIIAQINKEVLNLNKVSFFQVLRELNLQVDSLANEATTLSQGILKIMAGGGGGV
jgi:hypothetical protein